MKDLYKILGVMREATKEEIKKKYREYAKKYHPDKFSQASDEEKKKAEKIFREINEAYSILSDDEKRKEYDKELSKGTEKTRGRAKTTTNSEKPKSYKDIYEQFTKQNINDMFGNFFDPEKNKNEKVDTKLKEKTNAMFESYFFGGRKKKWDF